MQVPDSPIRTLQPQEEEKPNASKSPRYATDLADVEEDRDRELRVRGWREPKDDGKTNVHIYERERERAPLWGRTKSKLDKFVAFLLSAPSTRKSTSPCSAVLMLCDLG